MRKSSVPCEKGTVDESSRQKERDWDSNDACKWNSHRTLAGKDIASGRNDWSEKIEDSSREKAAKSKEYKRGSESGKKKRTINTHHQRAEEAQVLVSNEQSQPL